MTKPDQPWSYSSKDGYVAPGGKVRIYGFSQEPDEPLDDACLAGREPVQVDLEPGRYSWCTCGYSKKQPFCDNEHREAPTNRKSYKFEVLERSTFAFCMCKQTETPPFCDGSHLKCNGDESKQ